MNLIVIELIRDLVWIGLGVDVCVDWDLNFINLYSKIIEIRFRIFLVKLVILDSNMGFYYEMF